MAQYFSVCAQEIIRWHNAGVNKGFADLADDIRRFRAKLEDEHMNRYYPTHSTNQQANINSDTELEGRVKFIHELQGMEYQLVWMEKGIASAVLLAQEEAEVAHDGVITSYIILD